MKLLLEKLRVTVFISAKVNSWRFDPASVRDKSCGENGMSEMELLEQGELESWCPFLFFSVELWWEEFPTHPMKNDFQLDLVAMSQIVLEYGCVCAREGERETEREEEMLYSSIMGLCYLGSYINARVLWKIKWRNCPLTGQYKRRILRGVEAIIEVSHFFSIFSQTVFLLLSWLIHSSNQVIQIESLTLMLYNLDHLIAAPCFCC